MGGVANALTADRFRLAMNVTVLASLRRRLWQASRLRMKYVHFLFLHFPRLFAIAKRRLAFLPQLAWGRGTDRRSRLVEGHAGSFTLWIFRNDGLRALCGDRSPGAAMQPSRVQDRRSAPPLGGLSGLSEALAIKV